MDLLTHFKSLNYGRVDDIINNLVFSLFELVKSLVINTEEERDWKVNTVFLLWRELMKATTTIFLSYRENKRFFSENMVYFTLHKCIECIAYNLKDIKISWGNLVLDISL